MNSIHRLWFEMHTGIWTGVHPADKISAADYQRYLQRYLAELGDKDPRTTPPMTFTEYRDAAALKAMRDRQQ